MKYKVGDKVRIKSLDWFYDNRDSIDEVTCGNAIFIPDMVEYCGRIVTISSVLPTFEVYRIKEDGGMFNWTDDMIEGDMIEALASKTAGSIEMNAISFKSNLKYNRVTISSANCADEVEVHLDDDYEVVYRDGKMFAIKKKPKYSTTYEECCEILNIQVRDLDILNNMLDTTEIIYNKNLDRLLNSFRKLIVCRDAYWKIAGDEMGLGKSWEPDWRNSEQNKYVISNDYGRELNTHKIKCSHITHILAFPTEEMRDAFYENFKELIEDCKELL